MRLKRWMLPIPFLVGVAFAYGVHLLTSPPDLSTADRLAKALKAKGLDYRETTPVDLAQWQSAEVDEGLTLLGDSLRVDVLRIEDIDSFQAAQRASMRLTDFQGGVRLDIVEPIEIYARWPYVVVVRQEPDRGQVLAILQEVLPPEEWT